MTEQEVNRILAEFEGWNKIPNSYMEQMQRNDEYKYLFDFGYTYDWNDFHRVWMKFTTSDYLVIKQIQQLITHDPTPFQASYQLAKIIKLGK